jgi:hypothetical protein
MDYGHNSALLLAASARELPCVEWLLTKATEGGGGTSIYEMDRGGDTVWEMLQPRVGRLDKEELSSLLKVRTTTTDITYLTDFTVITLIVRRS